MFCLRFIHISIGRFEAICTTRAAKIPGNKCAVWHAYVWHMQNSVRLWTWHFIWRISVTSVLRRLLRQTNFKFHFHFHFIVNKREARLINLIIKMVIHLPRKCKYKTIYRKSRSFIKVIAKNRWLKIGLKSVSFPVFFTYCVTILWRP